MRIENTASYDNKRLWRGLEEKSLETGNAVKENQLIAVAAVVVCLIFTYLRPRGTKYVLETTLDSDTSTQ